MAGRPASKAAVSKARTPLPLPTVCKVVPGRPMSKAFVSKASSRSVFVAAVSKASSRTPLPVATSEGVEEVQPHQRLDCLYQRLDRLREMQRHRQEKMEQMRKEDEERRGRDRSRTPSRAAASGVGTPAAASGVDHRSQCQVSPTPSISPSGSGAGTKHAEVWGLKAELSMAFHGLEVRGLQALTGVQTYEFSRCFAWTGVGWHHPGRSNNLQASCVYFSSIRRQFSTAQTFMQPTGLER